MDFVLKNSFILLAALVACDCKVASISFAFLFRIPVVIVIVAENFFLQHHQSSYMFWERYRFPALFASSRLFLILSTAFFHFFSGSTPKNTISHSTRARQNSSPYQAMLSSASFQLRMSFHSQNSMAYLVGTSTAFLPRRI